MLSPVVFWLLLDLRLEESSPRLLLLLLLDEVILCINQ